MGSRSVRQTEAAEHLAPAEVAAGTEVRDVVEYRLLGGFAVRALEPRNRAFLAVLVSYRLRRLYELLG